ncbi:MAG: methyltransferase domain-containing protein [Fimbriimonas sp.]
MQQGGLFLSNVLDPRPSDEAAAAPIPGAVNIPVEELSDRTHELPARDRELAIVASGELLDESISALTGLGRTTVPLHRSCVAPGPSHSKPRLWSPNAFLEEVVTELSPARVIDIACGTGRDAVFLASLGWSVTAIDHLEDALQRGRDLEARYAPSSIDWRRQDAAAIELCPDVDLVTMFFFLDKELLKRVIGQLKAGAHLVLETFTAEHREHFGKPRSTQLVLHPGEITHIAAHLDVVYYSEGWHGGRHTARFWGRKV